MLHEKKDADHDCGGRSPDPKKSHYHAEWDEEGQRQQQQQQQQQQQRPLTKPRHEEGRHVEAKPSASGAGSNGLKRTAEARGGAHVA